MDVAELAPGLWRWTAGDASCFYVEAEYATVLVDPVVPADEAERFWRALDRDLARRRLPLVVLLTGAVGRGGADELVARYGAQVFTAAPGEQPPPASSAASPHSPG